MFNTRIHHIKRDVRSLRTVTTVKLYIYRDCVKWVKERNKGIFDRRAVLLRVVRMFLQTKRRKCNIKSFEELSQD